MINILPEEGRSQVKREYLLRLLSAGLFSLCVLGVLAAAMLLPSYFIAQVASGTAHLAAAHEASAGGSAQSADEQALARSGKEMEELAAYRNARLPSDAIKELLDALPSGVGLSHIEYVPGENRAAVAGIASTRENLLAYAHALEKVPGVARADLPVGSLARSENIAFSIAIVLDTHK